MILSGLVSGGLRKAISPENFHDLAQEAIFLSPPKYFWRVSKYRMAE